MVLAGQSALVALGVQPVAGRVALMVLLVGSGGAPERTIHQSKFHMHKAPVLYAAFLANVAPGECAAGGAGAGS
eukprot:10689581-Alexandrium_andersonii.AAC.1